MFVSPPSHEFPGATTTAESPAVNKNLRALTIAAMGVVFGDVGTSPLYTMKEIFAGTHPVPLELDAMLGILSLIFWSIFIIITLKYVLFIMCADNRGEGGIMALMALTLRTSRGANRRHRILLLLGLFGAALFYGDGMITPAISVLSAVEGLEVATPAFRPYVIPLTVAVLLALFLMQQRGTARVGALFGPVMGVWFTVLALLGIINIAAYPSVLAAVNPYYALAFFTHQPLIAFLSLGAVVLAVTGGEALYADMGHFGPRPIRFAWLGFVMPALLLNYFGQGALLLSEPAAISSPFYHQAPDWALYPLVILATFATVIASQAVISGAFSITRQAIQLGYCPRMDIRHTSTREAGQIYVPAVNWTLLIAIIALVVGFGSSTHLAAAYGVAVTGTMVTTTILAVVVARGLWGWSRALSLLALIGFLSVDLTFFIANLLKIPDGGWFPLIMAGGIFTLLSTWKRGRELLFERLDVGMPVQQFVDNMGAFPPQRVAGAAVFLSARCDVVPHALLHNLLHNKVIHEQVILLTVITEDIPRVPVNECLNVQTLGYGFYRITVTYGFKDQVDLPAALTRCAAHGLPVELMRTSFFFSRETVIPRFGSGMALWREHLFSTLARTSGSPMRFFRIPPNRVIEVGTQIEL